MNLKPPALKPIIRKKKKSLFGRPSEVNTKNKCSLKNRNNRNDNALNKMSRDIRKKKGVFYGKIEAIYFGPPGNFNDGTKDFTETINEHMQEFEINNKVDIVPQKYYIETQQIFDKFRILLDNLNEIYTTRYNKIGDDVLKAFIQAEIQRISIKFFANLKDVDVCISNGHEELKGNIKRTQLFTEKYNEEYMRDLIDPSKTFLKTYFLPFLNEEYIDAYKN